ncbi:MAG: hypothetical protein ACOX52_13885 [Verrucomicrobiota bacterium]
MPCRTGIDFDFDLDAFDSLDFSRFFDPDPDSDNQTDRQPLPEGGA